MRLEDPKNNAPFLKELFPENTKTPFSCGTPVKFTQTASRCDFICEQNPCEERCQQTLVTSFQVQAENCAAEKIDIFSSIAWATQVTQLSSPKYGQTWIEEFLSSADFFVVPSGVFEIVFVMPPQSKTLVDEYGEEHKIQSVSVLLDYKQIPTSPGIEFDLDLDLNQRGINQILYFGIGHNDHYFIKKWGLLQ